MFTAPQLQVQPSAAAGRGLPHSGQNLPVTVAPQLQVQLSAAGFGSGFLLPHSGQNLPVTVAPQLHCQLSAGAGAGRLTCWGASTLSGRACWPIANRFWALMPPIPPAPAAMPMPIKPVMAPAVLPAAVFMASIWPPTRRAAAVVGSVVMAFSSHSVIFFCCSSGMDRELMLKENTSMPRFLRQTLDSCSLSASEISSVWAGIS